MREGISASVIDLRGGGGAYIVTGDSCNMLCHLEPNRNCHRPRAHDRSGGLDRIRSTGGVSEFHVIEGENASLVSEKAAASSSGTMETPLYATLGMVSIFPLPGAG